jgi:hypothetical protein
MKNSTDPILPRLANAIAPAHLAESQPCTQCGADAWHLDGGLFFCRSHEQSTYAGDPECVVIDLTVNADGSSA